MGIRASMYDTRVLCAKRKTDETHEKGWHRYILGQVMFGTLRNSDTSTSLYIVVRVSFIGTEQNKLFAYPTCRISQAKLKSSLSLCI